jgi:Uma2 family endonuclease
MNEINRPSHFDAPAGPPAPRPTTQAADGYPRMHWTLEEFDRLAEAGILTEQDRIELIGGELVPMSPKGNRHENVRSELMNKLFRSLPDGSRIHAELGWRPDSGTYLEPDLLLAAAGGPASETPVDRVQLIIEIALTSFDYDTGLKARIYAALGVRDYWVLNALTLDMTVFREPAEGIYRSKVVVPATETVTPFLIPELALRLADLSLG